MAMAEFVIAALLISHVSEDRLPGLAVKSIAAQSAISRSRRAGGR
jgi:hypothetical protein